MDWTEILSTALIVIVAPVVTWALAQAGIWLRARAATDAERALVSLVEQHAASAVDWAAQTLGDRLRAGEWTDADKARVRRAALDRAAALLSPVALHSIQRAMGGQRTDQLIETAIEAAVRRAL